MTHIKLCECGCGEPAPISPQTVRSCGYIKGQPRRFIRGHHRKGHLRELKPVLVGRYRLLRTSDNGKTKGLHVLRAERALGHALPRGAQVHHADGTRKDDAPLVICENQKYHGFLHILLSVKRAGGNPHTHRVCNGCKQVLPFSAFYGNVLMLRCFRCRECTIRDQKAYLARRVALRLANG